MTLEDLKKFTEVNKEFLTPLRNRTRAYLLPALLKHGKEFKNKLNTMSFAAVGLYDAERERIPGTLTLLFNRKKKNIDINIPYIQDSYYFGELLYGHLHALVFSMPPEYVKSIQHFEKGEYSKMYKNPKEIFGLPSRTSRFFNEVRTSCHMVCIQDPNYRNELKNLLGGIGTTEELDSKIDPTKEIFNYSKLNTHE